MVCSSHQQEHKPNDSIKREGTPSMKSTACLHQEEQRHPNPAASCSKPSHHPQQDHEKLTIKKTKQKATHTSTWPLTPSQKSIFHLDPFVFAPIRPPEASSPSPNRFHCPFCLVSFREDDTEVDELRLKEAGEVEADDSGVEA